MLRNCYLNSFFVNNYINPENLSGFLFHVCYTSKSNTSFDLCSCDIAYAMTPLLGYWLYWITDAYNKIVKTSEIKFGYFEIGGYRLKWFKKCNLNTINYLTLTSLRASLFTCLIVLIFNAISFLLSFSRC